MRVKEEEGPALGAIVGSVFRAYRNALDQPSFAFEDLDDDQQSAWVRGVRVAHEMLEDGEGLPWVAFAAAMFENWAAACEFPERAFPLLDQITMAAWIAAAKHLANVADLSPGEDLEQHEARWVGAARRLGKPLP